MRERGLSEEQLVLSLTDNPTNRQLRQADQLLDLQTALPCTALHQKYGTIQYSAAKHNTTQHSTVGVVGRNRRGCGVVWCGGLSGSEQTRCSWCAMIGPLPDATVQSISRARSPLCALGVGCWSEGPQVGLPGPCRVRHTLAHLVGGTLCRIQH